MWHLCTKGVRNIKEMRDDGECSGSSLAEARQDWTPQSNGKRVQIEHTNIYTCKVPPRFKGSVPNHTPDRTLERWSEIWTIFSSSPPTGMPGTTTGMPGPKPPEHPRITTIVHICSSGISYSTSSYAIYFMVTPIGLQGCHPFIHREFQQVS